MEEQLAPVDPHPGSKKASAMLREMADRLDANPAVFSKLTTTTELAGDDFVIHTMTLRYFEA